MEVWLKVVRIRSLRCIRYIKTYSLQISRKMFKLHKTSSKTVNNSKTPFNTNISKLKEKIRTWRLLLSAIGKLWHSWAPIAKVMAEAWAVQISIKTQVINKVLQVISAMNSLVYLTKFISSTVLYLNLALAKLNDLSQVLRSSLAWLIQ